MADALLVLEIGLNLLMQIGNLVEQGLAVIASQLIDGWSNGHNKQTVWNNLNLAGIPSFARRLSYPLRS
jgi:hypothetical protein